MREFWLELSQDRINDHFINRDSTKEQTAAAAAAAAAAAVVVVVLAAAAAAAAVRARVLRQGVGGGL